MKKPQQNTIWLYVVWTINKHTQQVMEITILDHEHTAQLLAVMTDRCKHFRSYGTVINLN